MYRHVRESNFFGVAEVGTIAGGRRCGPANSKRPEAWAANPQELAKHQPFLHLRGEVPESSVAEWQMTSTSG